MKIILYNILFLILFTKISLAQIAQFKTSKDKDCNILKVTLDASASTGVAPLNYFWDFGNGNITSGTDKSVVEAIYVQPGTPVVSLYVIDATGKKSPVEQKSLQVLAGPKVDFSISTNVICTGKEFTLLNKTTKGSSEITGYIWNIGSNTSFNKESPALKINAPGEYDVTLTTTDANGCNVSEKKHKFIKIQNKFQAHFQAANTFSCTAPLNTEFKDLTNYSNVQGHQFSYLWNFGDGTTSAEKNPSKSYGSIGSYSVGVKITDLTEGCTSEGRINNYISAGGRKPKVTTGFVERKCNEFIYSLDLNNRNLPSNFINKVETGDGTSYPATHQSTFYHAYKAPGKYIIKTTYTNPDDPGCSQTGYDTLVISPLGEEILADNTNDCRVPMVVNFSTKNIPDAAFYEWNFGDNTYSSEPSPKKTYTQKGDYSVKLKVWSKKGCVYVISKNNFISVGNIKSYFTTDAKRIEELPREYEYTPIRDSSALWGGCIPFEVNFTNKSKAGNPLTYSWDFGDGTTSTEGGDVKHIYTQEGVFSPTLTISDNSGCADTFTCNNCVRAGSPPPAEINMSGPDTVCCQYDKTFAADVDLENVDLLWYNVALNDDAAPPGVSKAYYKDSTGNWILENHTEEFFPYNPPGMGLHYMTTNLSKPKGNEPDFYFYAYKNGCASKIIKPKYQHHVLPWGTFSPLPCDVEANLKAGDTIDFNKVPGRWLIGRDHPGAPSTISKAEISFKIISKNGCKLPEVKEIYTAESVGFELGKGSFEKIQEAGLFPKVVLPPCVQKGDVLESTTYLFTHDDARKEFKNGKCICEEHWPYHIGGNITDTNYILSAKSGCAPLAVDFKSKDKMTDTKWIFEDGTILEGNQPSHTFKKPGKYRFKLTGANRCSADKWTDSIEVNAVTAKFRTNKNVFCLNSDSINIGLNEIELIDMGSFASNDSIVEWKWSLGNGQYITQKDSSKISYTYTENDVPENPLNTSFVKLFVRDNNGCEASDSVQITLRKSVPAFSLDVSSGCYDTLRILPHFPKMGSHGSYTGSIIVDYFTENDTIQFTKSNLNSISTTPLLLDKKGSYNVHMQVVSDALGNCFVDGGDTIIHVDNNSLQPDFKFLSKRKFSCIPAMVETQDISTRFKDFKIKSWNWKFTNAVTNKEVNGSGHKPTPFAITDSGFYSITLFVEDESGCKKSITKDSAVYVSELKGTIDSLPTVLCPGETGTFMGSSLNGDFFYWDFGDGTIGEGLSTDHSYTKSGARNVSFIIQDSANCRKSYSAKIMVKDGPVFNLGNDTIVCEGEKLEFAGPKHADYIYSWNTGDTLPVLNISSPGSYWLYVKNKNLNCPYTDTVNVEFSPLPHVSINTLDPFCKDEEIVVSAAWDNTVQNVSWKKDNEIITQNLTPSVSLKGDKPYQIRVEVVGNNKCLNYDTLTLPLLERPQLSLEDIKICPGDSFMLSPKLSVTHPGFTFSYKFNGEIIHEANSSTLMVRDKGRFDVSYGKPNCYTQASSTLEFHPVPDVSKNAAFRILCEEDESIDIDGGVASKYAWLNSYETNRYSTVADTGIYFVNVFNEFGCAATDSIIVETRCEPKVYVPNAFTPEEEGVNDSHTIFGYNIGKFEISIFNRWGEIIYMTEDINNPWNGTYKGELMPSGVYPWIIKYTGNNPDYTDIQTMEGKVILVR